MPLRILAAAVMMSLTACGTVISNCPTLQAYAPELQAEAAEQLEALPKGSALVVMIGDYGSVRNEIRACRGDRNG